MRRPLLILDQRPRRLEEIFSQATYAGLSEICRIEGGCDRPMAPSRIDELLEEVEILVAARPALSADQVDRAPRLKAVIEVSGAFHDGLDYAACFARGIEVLSSSPGFRHAVAEMGMAMILAAARGLVAEHEAFRHGAEHWLDEHEGRDFMLSGQAIGFVGYGEIARELHRLLAPFAPRVLAYDPWLTTSPDGIALVDLDTVITQSRVVVVAAAPTAENEGIVDGARIDTMRPGSVLVLLGRAHTIDFAAAREAAGAGRITFATDVFPSEPVDPGDRIRATPNVILSPHRAAAVYGGRQPIGEMILQDVNALLAGRPDRQLKRADPRRVASLVTAQRQIRDAGVLEAEGLRR